MKRSFGVVLMLCLSLGALVAAPAEAKKKAKAQPVTFYFHGDNFFGEQDFENGVSGIYRSMDTTEPTEAAPKSHGLVTVGAGGTGTPNPQCAGSPFFPVWQGDVNGTVVGDIKVSLDSISLPVTKIDVRVWGMVPPFGSCDSVVGESYIEPAAELRVDVPPGAGTIEAVLKNVKFKAEGKVMIQFTPLLETPTMARVLYDSTSTISQMEFTCIPASGSSCTP